MKRTLIIVFMIMFLLPLLSFATSISIDLDKVTGDEAAMILNAKKKIDNPTENLPQPDVVEKYAKMGSEIGAALKEVCKTLSVEANEFVKTPVGMTVVGLIVYRYFGKDVIKLILMFIFCTTATIFNTISLWWWISKKRVVTDISEKVKKYAYIQRYNFNNNESRGFCVGFHIFVYIVIGFCSIVSIASL